MLKYAVTTGNSVISYLDSQKVTTTYEENPIYFNTIGEAMKAAAAAMKIVHSKDFKVISIEIKEHEP